VPRTCLGDLELKLGDVPAAIASLESWLQTHPHDAVAISNRLMAAQYVPGVTSHALRTLHRLWQDRIGDAIPLLPPLPPRSTPSRLRIGLVSGDLRAHPVGIFTIRAIEALSRHDVDIIAYSGTTAPDAITERFHACTTHWHDIAAWSDAQLAATIRHDAIDVLIDMAGHTTDIRLAAFARRPAPVQLSWAGYFGTTGCAAIDGVIADHRLVPAGEEKDYPETIWRLPNAYLCYDPPADAPPVLPRDPASPLNLAAFHHPAKINKSVVALWAQILHRHAQAVLHLTYDGLDDPDTKARITAWFAAAQIVPDRLVFRGRLPRAEYFALLGTMDIALDPLPYSGGAITCDALWMGVPVVTLPGASFASRHSQTHLLAAGLDAWVARDADDYVAIALRWATDPSALATLRHRLRAQVEASVLCDGPVFGADLLTLLRSAATSDTLLPAP
jgi:predicted O-linked N-acetylglucosamine transferase (SPINDLY family)